MQLTILNQLILRKFELIVFELMKIVLNNLIDL